MHTGVSESGGLPGPSRRRGESFLDRALGFVQDLGLRQDAVPAAGGRGGGLPAGSAANSRERAGDRGPCSWCRLILTGLLFITPRSELTIGLPRSPGVLPRSPTARRPQSREAQPPGEACPLPRLGGAWAGAGKEPVGRARGPLAQCLID